LATATVFALLVGVIVVLVTALGSLFVGQVSQLIDAIPGYAQQFADFLNDHFGTDLGAGGWPANCAPAKGCAAS
jgi:predicted PurR-regulated permease PerM